MKAASFDYAKPSTLAEAISLKQEHGDSARFLAGGQSLLPAMNMRVGRFCMLIDINGIEELEGISEDQGTVRIGALTRTQAVGKSEIVASCTPLLAKCVEHISHPAIRELGTFGGSVVQADPAAEWPAACLALDAKMIAVGPAGERAIDAGSFYKGYFETALAEDELLACLEFPVQPDGVRAVALEQVRRRGDFAIVGVLAQATPGPDGKLQEPRFAFFGLADRPVRLAEVERHLEASSHDAIEQAITSLEQGCTITGDLYHAPATKKYLAGVLVAEAIDQILKT